MSARRARGRIGARIAGFLAGMALWSGAALGAHAVSPGGTLADEALVPLEAVEVHGLPEAEAANVRAALGVARLVDAGRGPPGEARLRFLLRRAPAEARKALEPFGWYAPDVTVRREPGRDGVKVVVDIALGEPVRVRRLDARIDGAAKDDRFVTRELLKMGLAPGERFVHADYEAGKLRIDRKLAERGYFRAKRTQSRVDVSRAARSADVALHWDSGPRHAMGPVRFGPDAFRPGLLDALVDWTPGEPWHRNKLVRLQQRLARLDYFALVEVSPDEEAVDEALRVPVLVATTPAKRSRYTAALSIGTDSGAGVRGGVDRRWVNDRGHKWRADAEWSQRRLGASTQYRLPALTRLPGWYAAEVGYLDDDPAGALGFERTSVRLGWRGDREPWRLSADLVAAREQTRPLARLFIPVQRLAYPELSVQYRRVDDPVDAEDGLQLLALLRAGVVDDGREARRFAQLTLGAHWLRAFGGDQRLLLRADAGATRLGGEGEFTGFPTSLRFFAGGDRSIRGYGYREVGPRFEGEVLGGLHQLVASAEYQRYITPQWGLAAFVDAGDAFTTRRGFDPKVGVGVGLRWRSPVGLVAVDVAQGLDRDAGGGMRLHLGFGLSF